jgi:MoaA/NifB/PqqE/SkfB family radical SAM enzyme
MNLKYAFRPGKPALTARLASAVVQTNLLGGQRLRYVDFAVDFRCNLKCEHCFATALRHDEKRRMTPDDYGRVAEQAMRLGAVNFSFQGGEPLLFDKLPEIIKACRPHKNLISVTTNGTLLCEERINWLKAAGVDILTISLDSSDPAKHDKFRGLPGSFEKTVAGIKFALKAGLRVSVGTVVTHQSLAAGEIEGLIKFCGDLKILLYLILPVPAGKWIEKNDMMLSQDDLKKVYAWPEQYYFVRTDFQANFSHHGCGAAKEILYLTPYGDVLVCPFIHISPGNIFEESVETIRARAMANPWLDHYHDKCLASTDADFIAKHLSRTFGRNDLPLKWDLAFPKEEQKR